MFELPSLKTLFKKIKYEFQFHLEKCYCFFKTSPTRCGSQIEYLDEVQTGVDPRLLQNRPP